MKKTQTGRSSGPFRALLRSTLEYPQSTSKHEVGCFLLSLTHTHPGGTTLIGSYWILILPTRSCRKSLESLLPDSSPSDPTGSCRVSLDFDKIRQQAYSSWAVLLSPIISKLNISIEVFNYLRVLNIFSY